MLQQSSPPPTHPLSVNEEKVLATLPLCSLGICGAPLLLQANQSVLFLCPVPVSRVFALGPETEGASGGASSPPPASPPCTLELFCLNVFAQRTGPKDWDPERFGRDGLGSFPQTSKQTLDQVVGKDSGVLHRVGGVGEGPHVGQAGLPSPFLPAAPLAIRSRETFKLDS